ncbi:MAG: type II toxin-antitoxin system VapC family toxin [Flavobacteriales bacterium]
MIKMLDTNICSYILRRHPTVLAHLQSQDFSQIVLSSVVAAELRYGAQKSSRPNLHAQVEEWLSVLPILAWDDAATHCYAVIRVALEQQGRPIGGMDLMIAAHALAENAVLVTHNTREFARVEGLLLEDWV